MENGTTAKAHFESGKTFYAAEKFAEATSEFETAVLMDGQYAEAYYHWGLALIKNPGEWGKIGEKYILAAEKFKKAFELDATNEDALFQQATSLYNGKEFENSITVFENYIDKKFAKEYEALNFIGKCLEELTDFDKALKYYQQSVLIMPNDLQAYANMAISLAGMEQLEIALAKFSELKLPADKSEFVLLSWADKLRDTGKCIEAIKIYTKSLEYNANNAAVYNEIGYCLTILKKPLEAIDNFSKTISLNAEHLQVYDDTGVALAAIEKLETAEEKFAALKLPGDKAGKVLLTWANKLRDAKKYADAVKIYNQSLELNAGNASVYDELGYCLVFLNRPIEAIKMLEKSLKLDAEKPGTYWDIGIALAGIEQAGQAFKKFGELNLADDKAVLVLSKWAEKLNNDEQYAAAIAVYEKVLAIDPNGKDTDRNMANCLVKLNRPREAVESYKKAVDIDPQDEESLKSLGYYLYLVKDYKQAIEKFESYLDKKFFDEKYALMLIGLCWQNLKNYEKALEYFDKSILADPGYSYTYRNKAYTLFLNGDANKCINLYESIIKKNPGEKENYFDYGNVLLDLNLYNEAIEQYRKALAIDENYASASHNIAHIYVRTGRFEKATKQWESTTTLYEKNKAQFMKDNDYSYYLFNGGIQSQYLRNRDYAEKILLEGIELFPESTELLYEFARLNKAQKDQLRISNQQSGKRQEYNNGLNDKINNCHVYLWESYRKATRILTKDIEVNNTEINYRKLGEFHLLIEDFDRAADCLNKAISFDHGNIDSYTSLGVAQLKNGNYPEAIRNFKKGLLIDPEDMNLQTNLAEALVKLKNYPDADNIYQRLYVVTPFYQEVLLGLGELYKIMGDNALERKSNPESEEYFKKSRDYFYESLAVDEKPAAASRALTLAEISSVNYSLGYINAKLYETQADHPLGLLQDSVNNFSKVNVGDSNSYKANISIAKISAILNKKSWIVSEKASSVIIVSLALLVFISAQICFFYGRPVFSTTYSIQASALQTFIEQNKLDSIKPALQKLSLIQGQSKEDLQAKIIRAIPASIKNTDIESLAGNAAVNRVKEYKQIDETPYAFISFGSLIFIMAGLVLKQLSKLKVGTIELEKATIETASTSASTSASTFTSLNILK